MVHDPEAGGNEPLRLDPAFSAARPVDRRRPPRRAPEESTEGAEALEANLETDLRDAHLGFAEESPGQLHPLSNLILVRCYEELTTELTDEMKSRHVRLVGEASDRQRLVRRRVDSPLRPSCRRHGAVGHPLFFMAAVRLSRAFRSTVSTASMMSPMQLHVRE